MIAWKLSLFVEEVAAAGLVEGGQVLGPTSDDFAGGRAGLELLNGGIVAEEQENFGEIKLVGIFFVLLGGDFEADSHRAQRGSVGYAHADAAAVLARVEAADGNEGLIHEMNAWKIFCVEH